MRKVIKRSDTREYHGYAGTPTYRSWAEMRKRCYNENVIRYPEYGGRGIKVCDKWKESFSSFLADMGERPVGKTLDRLDLNGNYEPTNCRWADKQQQANNKSNSHMIKHNGSVKTASEWSRETGIPDRIIRQRITRDKLPPEIALTRKVK